MDAFNAVLLHATKPTIVRTFQLLWLGMREEMLEARYDLGRNLLHVAAERGFDEMVELLTERDEDFERLFVADEGGMTPLHCAAQTLNNRTVYLLISRGADKTLRDVDDLLAYDHCYSTLFNPLMEAMLRPEEVHELDEFRNLEMLRCYRIQSGFAIPSDRERSFEQSDELVGVWRTMCDIEMAMVQDEEKVVSSLATGAFLEEVPFDDLKPFLERILQCYQEKYVKHTLRKVIQVIAVPEVLRELLPPCVLHTFAEELDLRFFVELVKTSVFDINEQDSLGDTVLHKLCKKAAGQGTLLTIIWLLEAGADPDARNQDARLPFSYLSMQSLSFIHRRMTTVPASSRTRRFRR